MLDDEQIDRRIRLPLGKEASDKDAYSNLTRGEYLAQLHFLLARATLRHDVDRDVAATATRHQISEGANLAILELDSAETKVRNGRKAEACTCLANYETLSTGATLHGSWHLHAARLALIAGEVDRAKRLFARVRVPDLTNLEHKSEEVAEAAPLADPVELPASDEAAPGESRLGSLDRPVFALSE